MPGVYAGIVAGILVLVLLGYTTTEEIIKGIRAWKGSSRQHSPDITTHDP